MRLRESIERLRPAVPYLPALLVTGWFAYKAISGILDRSGQPAVPLDDAFIHFQYARNLASGHFFHYAPGEGYVAGATSLLWPILLAPFYFVGFRDLSIIWIAWALGFAAFGALLVEVHRLTDKLTGSAVAMSASAMCALFGGFIWFAASGMETIPLAWAFVRTARLASDWCESPTHHRSHRLRTQILAFGLITPLLRPEGALASLIAATALLAFPDPTLQRRRARLLGSVPLAGLLITPTLHLIMTGSASSNTTVVKWLPASPYYPTLGRLWEPIASNVSLMFSTLLDGQQWSAVFLPEGSLPIALTALAAIPVAGWRSGKPWRAFFVAAIALSIFVPCTYHTFLWNRLRYLWPFTPAWFIGVACAARLVGDTLAFVRLRWALVAPVIGGAVAGAFTGNLKWALTDLSKSASAIHQQQVTLGRWARDNLPPNAIIGVNDTGAIAYLSERRTFDIVGLTTQGEGPYWVAGPGSRFEHYERIHHTAPHRFPTHFIVYPNWMQCEPLLGKRLHEVSVYDQTILGGVTMAAYEARTDLLGSGASPIETTHTGNLVDELDVADLESEAEHAYQIEHGSGNEVANKVHSEFLLPDGPSDRPGNRDDDSADRIWADGGRFYRSADRFVAKLRPGIRTQVIARWTGSDDGDVEVVVESGSRVLATLTLGTSRAKEYAFDIPSEAAAEATPIQVRILGGLSFGSLHYWFYTD